jgi:hypothetical protein
VDGPAANESNGLTTNTIKTGPTNNILVDGPTADTIETGPTNNILVDGPTTNTIETGPTTSEVDGPTTDNILVDGPPTNNAEREPPSMVMELVIEMTMAVIKTFINLLATVIFQEMLKK